MFYDCHTHTSYSGHSEDYTISGLKEEAARKGIEISIREHAPLPSEFFDETRKNHYIHSGKYPVTNFVLHSGTIFPFFTEAAKSDISLGFEVDILPGFEKGTERMLRNMGIVANYFGVQIDAINGSHHIYNGRYWDFSPETLADAIRIAGGCNKFIKSYFGQIRDAMKTGFYGTISHLEFICRFNAQGSELESIFLKSKETYGEEIEKTFSVAKECNVAIEYNTSGIDAKLKSPYLSGNALHLAYHMNVPLVIGSDAHAARQIGRHFDFAAKQMKEYGINKLHYFKNREMASYSI